MFRAPCISMVHSSFIKETSGISNQSSMCWRSLLVSVGGILASQTFVSVVRP